MKGLFRFSFLFMALSLCTMMTTFSACGGDDDDPISQPINPEPNDNGGSGFQTSFQVMRTCGVCDGSTICPQCNGSGKGCGTCGGTGRYCKDCGTTGKCQECKGTKNCKYCSGDGWENCTHCERWPGHCSTCDGVGWRISSANPCTTCGGSGKCKYCLDHPGKSGKECWYCEHTGDCQQCSGSGKCRACGGNPECSRCGGTGNCNSCGGSSKCRNCQGTGETRLEMISFGASGGEYKVFIHSTSAWSASANVEWVKFSRTSGSGDNTITVTFDKNPTITSREGIITFVSGNSKTTVEAIQWGESVKLDVSPSYVFVWCWGMGEDTIHISSNTSWKVNAADSWVSCTPSSGSGDATVIISASGYYDGTRYTTLTFSDTSGDNSTEVIVAQALYPGAVNFLKNLLEKPFGTIDVNMKTSSYQQVRNAVAKVYKLSYESSVYKSFDVSFVDNPSLNDITYQGLTLYNFSFSDNGSFNDICYSFSLDKSQASDGYKTYLNKVLQDYKYTLGAELIDEGSNQHYIELWSGRDADNNLVGIWVKEYSDSYSFLINCFYNGK